MHAGTIQSITEHHKVHFGPTSSLLGSWGPRGLCGTTGRAVLEQGGQEARRVQPQPAALTE